MISSKSPGKLYIAGEYAVVEKGHSAILIAVDQFITVNLIESDHRGSIQAFDNSPIPFSRDKDRLVLDYRDNSLSYVINSINVVESIATTLNIPLKFYDLSIDSELVSDEGKKYGLGSSAAVTVSTIKVLCKFYNISVSKLELFKLAAIVHLNINSNGSCGDIASSVYGGWIHFKTFDRHWAKEELKVLSNYEMMKVYWPYLEINELNVPSDLKLLIGWTQSPASTTLLVDQINTHKKANSDFYDQFLENSENVLSVMIEAFKNNDTKTIMKQISSARNLLRSLDSNLHMNIETPTLAKLSNIAEKYDAAAKSSGAGGGDCGIVIMSKSQDESELVREWTENNIENLHLNVYEGE